MLGIAMVLSLLPVRSQSGAADVALNRLVFGCQVAAATAVARAPDVLARWRRVDDRCQAFEARRPAPASNATDGMVAYAHWLYEQRLFAVAAGDAAAEAARYVAALRPCYEWEGFHDCPEREAAFADRYLTEHRESAFAAYLPLLAAHRWLCAAEGYEYETTAGAPASKQGVGQAQARRNYVARLEGARRSKDRLVRVAADELRARGTCF